MKTSQSDIILKRLEEAGTWIPSYNLIKVDTRWGWLGSSGDRFARWLAEDGVIEKKRDGKYTFYKCKVIQPSLI